MKKVKKRREINLGCNEETKHLVLRYRILKALERSAHKFAPNLDQAVREEIGENYKLAKDLFINYACKIHENNLLSSEDYLHSNELGILSSLFNILKDNNLLEEAIAEVTYRELGNSKINEKQIRDYASHLCYYEEHPEIHKEYKLVSK